MLKNALSVALLLSGTVSVGAYVRWSRLSLFKALFTLNRTTFVLARLLFKHKKGDFGAISV